MKKKIRRKKPSGEVHLGFQIAPMIDVVFVIMLFFMVMAGAVKVETLHSTKLPGETVKADTPTDMPDEISIKIEDDGQVFLNDDPLDTPENKNLPELATNLVLLKKSSDGAKSKVLVTVYASEEAKYERVMNVLDALSRAEISNVTFQAGAPE